MRMTYSLLPCLLAIASPCFAAGTADLGRWQERASHISISRDEWGIAHVYGQSDADAVFGALYAQAEDDFPRIERNYLVALGWLAQVEGESAVYQDLRARLFVDVARLQREYRQGPRWLQTLMTAWADGLNFYLYRHPEAHPKRITHFEPWMALAFTEGSIGGDIETISLEKLAAFYSGQTAGDEPNKVKPGGSNGFAIAPRLSASGHALLWINPHTSFYFRSELQMVSGEGLDVYGAATWGQMFIYQGFNEHNGWMHTSNGGDAIDEYSETIIRKADGVYYRYGNRLRKLREQHIEVPYRRDGALHTRSFTAYFSHHGPIIRSRGEKWIAIRLLQEPALALQQSYLRTKTRNFAEFYQTQLLRTDTSNNTVYADSDGTIAYFHGNFIPKRNPQFDFTRPVDGSNPATEWQGKSELKDTIIIVNPKSGWVQNTNSWPFQAAGADSPKRDDYPVYMWSSGENPRDLHAVALLTPIHAVTVDSLIATAYDTRLTAFDALLPRLFAAYDRLPPQDPLRTSLAQPVQMLRAWDRRTAVDSVPTAIAVFWAEDLRKASGAAAVAEDEPVYHSQLDQLGDEVMVAALNSAIARLERDFGSWRTPWGEINRYQRLTGDVVQSFDDSKPSLAVGMGPARWGALAAFDAWEPESTKRIYGTGGNSFAAAVEFGPRVRAKAILVGGESGNPASPHFSDQARRYIRGEFREVWFYPEDVSAHAQRTYRPGE
ncbi:MAG: penicillin acylase family protein [Proteobacteria bacterium]|nr:penicillin acylase family protein [Pseudomonadota bacterium]